MLILSPSKDHAVKGTEVMMQAEALMTLLSTSCIK